jgi:hypothetical protein
MKLSAETAEQIIPGHEPVESADLSPMASLAKVAYPSTRDPTIRGATPHATLAAT